MAPVRIRAEPQGQFFKTPGLSPWACAAVAVLKFGRSGAVLQDRRQLSGKRRFHRTPRFSTSSAPGFSKSAPAIRPWNRHGRVGASIASADRTADVRPTAGVDTRRQPLGDRFGGWAPSSGRRLMAARPSKRSLAWRIFGRSCVCKWPRVARRHTGSNCLTADVQVPRFTCARNGQPLSSALRTSAPVLPTNCFLSMAASFLIAASSLPATDWFRQANVVSSRRGGFARV